MTSKTAGLTLANTVGYEEFAELAGIKVSSLRVYASSKETRDQFPKPVTPPEVRSPRWSREDAIAWKSEREERAKTSRAGRPPKSDTQRIRFTDEQRAVLKTRIDQSEHTVLDIARALGFSRRAIVQRLEGLSGWKKSELQELAKMLRVNYSALTKAESRSQ